MDPSCTPVDTINCQNYCSCSTQTKTVAQLAQDFLAGDTVLYLVEGTVVPCCGYGMFTGCGVVVEPVHTPCSSCSCAPCKCPTVKKGIDEKKFEIFKWGNATVDPDGRVALTNLVRGLNWYGCDDNNSNANLIKDHFIKDELKVADINIHYYRCKECECSQLDCEEVRACENQQITQNGDQVCITAGDGVTPLACITLPRQDNVYEISGQADQLSFDTAIPGINVCYALFPNVNGPPCFDYYVHLFNMGTFNVPYAAPAGYRWVLKANFYSGSFGSGLADTATQTQIQGIINGSEVTVSNQPTFSMMQYENSGHNAIPDIQIQYSADYYVPDTFTVEMYHGFFIEKNGAPRPPIYVGTNYGGGTSGAGEYNCNAEQGCGKNYFHGTLILVKI